MSQADVFWRATGLYTATALLFTLLGAAWLAAPSLLVAKVHMYEYRNVFFGYPFWCSDCSLCGRFLAVHAAHT